jgi:hypothetical protein
MLAYITSETKIINHNVRRKKMGTGNLKIEDQLYTRHPL